MGVVDIGNNWKLVMKRIFLLCLGILTAGVGLGCQSEKPKDPATLYANVPDVTPDEILLAQGLIEAKPKKAIKIVNKWIKSHKGHPAMDEALYTKALAQEARNRPYDALRAYDELTKSYSGSEHFYVSLEKEVEIAERFLEGLKRPTLFGLLWFTAKEDSLEVLENVALRWPGSELAGRALMLRANHYFDNKRFLDAQQAYLLVIDNYKSSPDYQIAFRRCADATYALYGGPLYDATSLAEALTRYRQYSSAFPVSAEQEGVPEIIRRIQSELAQKDYEIADFYQRTHKPVQAQYYWTYIAQTWPDTESAAKSRQQLAAIP